MLFKFTNENINIITTNYTSLLAETIKKYIQFYYPNINCVIRKTISDTLINNVKNNLEFIIFIGTIHVINSRFINLIPDKKYYVIQIEQLNQTLYYYHKIDDTICKFLKNSKDTFDYSFVNFKYYPYSIKNKIRYINIYRIYNLIYFSKLPICNSLSIDASKSIDILFIGTLNTRREKILDYLKNNFDINIVIVSNVFGSKLINKLHNTKIVINLHYYDNAILEIFRILDVLSNSKCYIISEVPDNKQETYLIKNYCKQVEFIDTIDKNLHNISNLTSTIHNIMSI